MAPDIQISVPNDGKETFVHRFRNFGEDVFRQLRDECAFERDEIDSSTTKFHVRNVKRSKLRKTCREIECIAEKHFFDKSLVVKEL